MYLREIQLLILYQENKETIQKIMSDKKCSYEEAYKLDYNLNWKSQISARFDLETRCIADMFIMCLGKYHTKDCQKMVIHCVDKVKRSDYRATLGIGVIEYAFDFRGFFNKTDHEKKIVTARIIKDCMYSIVEQCEWDLAPIENAFCKMEEMDYKSHGIYGNQIKSPNRLYTAELYIEHEIEAITFYAIVRDKESNIIDKKIIITTSPSHYFYRNYLGKLQWISQNKLRLVKKDSIIFPLIEVNIGS